MLIVRCLLVLLTTTSAAGMWLILGAGSAMAFEGTLGSTEWGSTLNYTISGIDVDEASHQHTTDAHHTYSGKITGAIVTVSGSFIHGISPGMYTKASAGFTIAGTGVQTSTWSWPPEGESGDLSGGSTGQKISGNFELKVNVPESCEYLWISGSLGRNGGAPEIDTLMIIMNGRGQAAPRIPLCPRALQFFTAAELANAEFKDCLRLDLETISTQFDQAITDYNLIALQNKWSRAYHDNTLCRSAPMLLWLFTTDSMKVGDPNSLTDTEAYKVRYFKGIGASFTNTYYGVLNKHDTVVPEISEYNLAEQIIAESKRRTSAGQDGRLQPGEVFGLALTMVRGNANQALLLAHNTIRSAVRGIGTGLTGVELNTGCTGAETFETKHLAPLREGENGGPWYHFFGTAYFELSIRNDTAAWAFNNDLDFLYLISQLMTDQFFAINTGQPGAPEITEDQYVKLLSSAANNAEQYWRQLIDKRRPDPEKYCVNIWGQVIAERMTSQLADGPNRDIRPPLVPLAPSYGGRFIDLSGMHMGIVHCPVIVTLSGDGGTLRFDPATQSFSGTAPAYVLPFIEADNELGLCWFEVPGHPVHASFEGTREGQLLVGEVVFGGAVRGSRRAVQPGQVLDYTALFDNQSTADVAQPVWQPPVASPGGEVQGVRWQRFDLGEVALTLPPDWYVQPSDNRHFLTFFNADKTVSLVVMHAGYTREAYLEEKAAEVEWQREGVIGGRDAIVTQYMTSDGRLRSWLVTFTVPLRDDALLHLEFSTLAESWATLSAEIESAAALTAFE